MSETRRSVLRPLGTAGAVGLAGRSSGGSGDGGTTTAPAETTDGESDGGESWTRTDTVDVTDELTFQAKRTEVSVGRRATWETVGSIGHTVTADEDRNPEGAAYLASGGFDSESAVDDSYSHEGNVRGGESYEYTFETKGTYEYYCIPYEPNGMTGYLR